MLLLSSLSVGDVWLVQTILAHYLGAMSEQFQDLCGAPQFGGPLGSTRRRSGNPPQGSGSRSPGADSANRPNPSAASAPDLQPLGSGSRHNSRAGARSIPHDRQPSGDPVAQSAAGKTSRVAASPGCHGRCGVRACACCGITAEALENGKLNQCSACRAVQYCGKGCQSADWPAHKAMCKRLRGVQS